jgi:hypothetical protein
MIRFWLSSKNFLEKSRSTVISRSLVRALVRELGHLPVSGRLSLSGLRRSTSLVDGGTIMLESLGAAKTISWHPI